LIEFEDGRVIAVEVKADSAPGPDAARHLRWLRDGVGSQFALGVVLHTGPRPFRLDESIIALPICALWGWQARPSLSALSPRDGPVTLLRRMVRSRDWSFSRRRCVFRTARLP
jgi:hypothetical protein